MRNIILMDLDGTLTDSSEGIFHSILYTIKKLNLPTIDGAVLNSFIGPPLADSFQRVYQLNDSKTKEAVAAYREYFAKTGIHELTVYAGIVPVLKKLADKYDLYIATSKPEVYAKQILQETGLNQYFKNCFGADLVGDRGQKWQVIAYALSEIKPTAEKIIMVGDREHDIAGAQKNSLKSIGVLYGYGDQKELQEADVLVETPERIPPAVEKVFEKKA